MEVRLPADLSEGLAVLQLGRHDPPVLLLPFSEFLKGVPRAAYKLQVYFLGFLRLSRM